MDHVVYYFNNGYRVVTWCRTVAGAKRSVKHHDQKGRHRHAWATIDDYREMVKTWRAENTKMVKNLMTGEEVEIPQDTPLCLDPSSETYWSM